MTVAYVDTSALGKLLTDEEHSDALAAFFNESRMGELVSSTLLETELRRMASRHDLPQADVTELLARVTLVVPERDFFPHAGMLPGRHLRSLDALHLVTAIEAEADVVISYDQRMLEAADRIGLPTVAPT